jgi:hypothetical protein
MSDRLKELERIRDGVFTATAAEEERRTLELDKSLVRAAGFNPFHVAAQLFGASLGIGSMSLLAEMRVRASTPEQQRAERTVIGSMIDHFSPAALALYRQTGKPGPSPATDFLNATAEYSKQERRRMMGFK